MPDTAPRLTYSVNEAAAALSIGRTQLFDMMRRGEIPSIKIGRRRIIPAAALENYLARLVDEQAGGAA